MHCSVECDTKATMIFLTSILILLFIKPFVLSKHVTSAVVFDCGKPRLYLTTEGWIQDTPSPCTFSPADVIDYCRQIYADKSIDHAVFSPVIHVLLQGWCDLRNSSCSRTLDDVHVVQPWICTDNKPTELTIPPGCELRTFGGSSVQSCHKHAHWFNIASTHCDQVTEVDPIKPCIKSGSYLHKHFLGVKAVCCPGGYRSGSDVSHPFIRPQPNVNRQSAKFRERQNFVHSKQTQQANVNSAKSLLLQQLLTAESQLTDKDWIEHPEETQRAEDVILEDFRHNYVNLSTGAQQARHRLESAHQRRVLDFMRQNEATMLSLLDSVVNHKPVNFSQLLEHMERMLHVIENNRYHVLKRFEHLRALNVDNTTDEVILLKDRLRELDVTFNTSLDKLSKVPKYKPTIVQHILQLRKTEYSHVESFAKSFLVSSVPVRNDSVERARLEAEDLIDRYRHHFIGGSNGSSDGLVDGWRRDHASKFLVRASEVLPVTYLNHGPVDASTRNASLAFHNQSQEASTVKHHSTTLTTVLVSIFLLLSIVCGVLAVRYYRRQSRLRREGYTSSLVEVDEVSNARGGGSGHVGNTGDPDELTYWIPGGFENPTYKYSDNLLR